MGDQTLTCRNCGDTFHYAEGEQVFYEERGYKPPQFCPHCRDLRRAATGKLSPSRRTETRQLFDAVCSDCGAPTRVPFEPIEGRAVYCADCFANHRTRV